MPTVPSTCHSLSSLERVGVYIPGAIDQVDVVDAPSCPTPDPDLDDVVLVPVVTGDGFGSITSESSFREDSRALSHSNEPPSLPGLGDLVFHSPSSILGTPFDVSPKFEYPFPPSIPDHQSTMSSIHKLTVSSTTFPASLATIPLPLVLPISLPRQRRDSLTATHLKLQHREPPVPPRLSTKGWSLAMNAPGRTEFHAKRSDKKSVTLAIARPFEQPAPSSMGPVDSVKSSSGHR